MQLTKVATAINQLDNDDTDDDDSVNTNDSDSNRDSVTVSEHGSNNSNGLTTY